MDPDLLLSLKALSDGTRLRIVGLLAARPMAVEELADALRLTPPTIAHHLKRLRVAGLVESRARHPYVEYALRPERLDEIGRKLDEIERGVEAMATAPAPGGEPLPAFEAKVLRAFFDGERLVSIPAQEKKRLVVLRYLRDRCFGEDHAYPEREVNALLSRYHADTASLRRFMIGAGLMVRAGGVYRRA